MDLRVLDLQYRLEQTQRHLKGHQHLSEQYKNEIKEIEKILAEIKAIVVWPNQSQLLN